MEIPVLPPGVFAHSLEGLWGILGVICLVTCGIPIAMLPFAFAFRITRKAAAKRRDREIDAP